MANLNGAPLACYEDGFTHSVTLIRPKVSPLQRLQLAVGFLQEHGGDDLSYHVDLLACMRAGSGPQERDKFAQHLEKRFPYYDDAWFAAEWNTEPYAADVLQALKGPWHIRTFISLLDTQEMSETKVVLASLAMKDVPSLMSAGLTNLLVYFLNLPSIDYSIVPALCLALYFLIFLSFQVGMAGIAR